jgi:hypothetical protein
MYFHVRVDLRPIAREPRRIEVELGRVAQRVEAFLFGIGDVGLSGRAQRLDAQGDYGTDHALRLAVVAKRAPRLAQLLRQRRVRDRAIGPKCTREFSLAQRTAAREQQELDQIEDLGLDFGSLAGAADLARVEVDLDVVEAITMVEDKPVPAICDSPRILPLLPVRPLSNGLDSRQWQRATAISDFNSPP